MRRAKFKRQKMERKTNSKRQKKGGNSAIRTVPSAAMHQEVVAPQDGNAGGIGAVPRSTSQTASFQLDRQNSALENPRSSGAAVAALRSAASAATRSGQVPDEVRSYPSQGQNNILRDANIASILSAIQIEHRTQNMLESSIIDQLSLALSLERRRAQLTAELNQRLQAQVHEAAVRSAWAQANSLRTQQSQGLSLMQPPLLSELQQLQRMINQQPLPPNQLGLLPARGPAPVSSTSGSIAGTTTIDELRGAEAGDEMPRETVMNCSRQEPCRLSQGSLTELPGQQRKDHPDSFPQKLYRLLVEAEAAGREDIVSFEPSGRAFRVHRPKAFMEDIAPSYFRLTRIGSFRRQLNLYGFQRNQVGPEEGAYAHENFQRGRPDLVAKIVKIRK